jgi:FtsH-binding integral membrane protein
MGPYPNSYYPNSYAAGQPYAAGLDVGAIMRRVYLWLAMGLALGFGVAFALGRIAENAIATNEVSGAAAALFNPVALIIAMVAYLGIGIFFYPIVRRVSLSAGMVLYFAFTAVFGFLISDVFVVYSSSSIAAAFLVTAAMFGAMALIGYTTKADLSKIGSIAIMALIGLIVASLVNLFLHSAALYWVVTYAGVAIFCALTAYDVQWIRRQAVQLAGSGDELAVGRVALIGAFHLFLDFVNLFLFLLRIFGRGRN